MLIMLPGKLNRPSNMPMTDKIIVIVRAHLLPAHRPQAIMNPNIANNRIITFIAVKNAVVKAIKRTPVNLEVHGTARIVFSRSCSGIKPHPPAPKKAASPIKAIPPNNVKKLTIASKIARILTPMGLAFNCGSRLSITC